MHNAAAINSCGFEHVPQSSASWVKMHVFEVSFDYHKKA